MELLDDRRTHVGYLLKDRVMDRYALRDAVRRVHAGEVVVDAALVEALLNRPAVPAALRVLSPRERNVLALMAEGAHRPGHRRAAGRVAEDGRHADPAYLRPPRDRRHTA
ncbi:hypothetical protein [Dactylosporangium vinaceum]|uniref:Uncharacterized protein n=1 Tax=Dactylosporangium vinaceum TaxID=53362 RepID=A0ABV5MME5_9ACTN|nr:hypothetical protein [Dactylosporangium vinaceum]